jgi:outer membrane protein assembly factor BamB
MGPRRVVVAVALGTAIAVAGSLTASALSGASSPNVPRSVSTGALTTYDYDNARSGHDTVDPTVRSLSSSATWNDTLDGAVYGQPLVYRGVAYVGTENDTIYALAATTGHVLWKLHVGTAVNVSIVDSAPTLGSGCGDIDPLGITGTPVIDTSTRVIYAVEETLTGGSHWQNIRHWLVAVSLSTHRELWHRDADPPDANEANHYYIAAEQQRPALTLYKSHVYFEYGGLDGDCGAYHGYVVGLPAGSPSGPMWSYQVPTQREGGIWGTGGAFVSASGDLYVATGNGSSNSLAHFDEGNSVVELSPTLHRLGYYAPRNWVELNNQDWDLGSASPIAVPNTSLLVAAGKPSDSGTIGYLMHDKLGGIGHGAFSGDACHDGGVFGADASDVVGTGASARTYLYLACGGGTEAIEVHVSNPLSFHEVWQPSTGTPNGSPIVAGGYVWALDWNGGTLYAMSPTSGHVVFTRATDGLNHFATPALGDGVLLVPTQGGVEAFRVTS